MLRSPVKPGTSFLPRTTKKSFNFYTHDFKVKMVLTLVTYCLSSRTLLVLVPLKQKFVRS